jgi:hypothetical protein
MNINTKIKRELKEAEIMLSDVEAAIQKGWCCYLGDPIFKVRREVVAEVGRLRKSINKPS